MKSTFCFFSISVALLLIASSATVSAQGGNYGFSMGDDFFSYSEDADGNQTYCAELAGQGGCFTRNREGRVTKGSGNFTVPVYAGIDGTLDVEASDNGWVTVCPGAEVGIKKAKVGAQGCAEFGPYGTIRVYGRGYGQIGPFWAEYETEHRPIHRDH